MLEKLPEFMANNSMLFVAVGVIVGLIIINEWRISSRGFSSILPNEVVQKINHGAKVLDIRAESVFKQGHIVDSLHMPADKVAHVVAKISDKNQPIVVACETGMRCNRVASVLVKDGYTQVSILRGGIQAWINDKLPLSN